MGRNIPHPLTHVWIENGDGSGSVPVVLASGSVTLDVLADALPGAAADVNAPAANTAAVVTYAAQAATRQVIGGVAWSYYGGIPTGGNLAVATGGSTLFNVDIAEEGPGFFTFPRPLAGALGANMVITLAAGGAGITGKVSVLNHWGEAG